MGRKTSVCLFILKFWQNSLLLGLPLTRLNKLHTAVICALFGTDSSRPRFKKSCVRWGSRSDEPIPVENLLFLYAYRWVCNKHLCKKLPLFPNIGTTALLKTLQLTLDLENVELSCEPVHYRLICTGTTDLQQNNLQCVACAYIRDNTNSKA